jgi:modulator of FtsH protease HflK
MPWNDNANPGPWGSPPEDGDRKDTPSRRPRGDGGGPRGPRRPDVPNFNAGFEELARRLRGLFGGPGGVRPGVVAAIVGVAFALWAVSGVYMVQPNEEAVVTTFGAWSRNGTPGLNYHLPAPIERVEKVPVTSLNLTTVGGTQASDEPDESLMITGDKNIVHLNFSVAWRISDAARYIFATRDQRDAVKAVAESAMREVVGKTALQPILTTGRGKLQQETADLMQRTLDSWGAGIRVVEVQIRTAGPPAEVAAAFRDVQSADQDRQSAENEANAYRNRVVNEARGDAARITQAAAGYREQAVRDAMGEAARFNQLYTEYRRAPGVTRDRLYIETMQRILSRSNKVVIDAKGATAPIILPPDVFRPRSQTEAEAQPQQQQPQAQSGRTQR